MSDIEMKFEADAEEFTAELSDEALDRAGAPPAPRMCICTGDMYATNS